MKRNPLVKLLSVLLCAFMVAGMIPAAVFANDNVAAVDVSKGIDAGDGFGTNDYYTVISSKEWTLVPGAAYEREIVVNNKDGNRRQVMHVIEVDPSNPDVSIVPGYNQIDKDLTNEANWSHKELTEMAKYYESNLGYNIVGGMNTDLYYDTYAPRILVYNGKDLSVKGKTSPSSSILYVLKDAEGNISCEVKAFNRAEFDGYLADGTLLHAVGVSFGMVVKDGELVKKTEERTSSAAARSMVGIKEDGTLVICMNDGRGANNSVGFCDYEEGEAMLALGCKWAANCDGGGSSTFLTKRVGEETFTMRSVPCDGAQRPTAHGIFVTSNVAPTGILNNVNIESEYDIFAPKTTYTFGAEAIDTHGYAMEMPADASWALSDASFGSISNGKFVSNGKMGVVDIQIVSGGKVVGSKTITVADPVVFKLSQTSTVMPYSTADKVRTISLPIVAMTGEANVYIDTNAVSVSLSDTAAGTLDGFKFTSTENTAIAGVNVTVTYGETILTYAIEFGKGSEIIWDFEDGDKAGFMGFEEAKKWSQDNGVNNTLVGSGPLDGQFNSQLSSTTFIASTTNGGQVRNGNYALAWRLDNSDADFANWSYNVLFNTNDVIVFRDVANGIKATTLGMWIYIPENAFPSGSGGDYTLGKGLAFQSQLNSYANWAVDGKASCVQDHFMFTSAATGKKTNLNSATNADIPESRWVYATIDISKYDYLSTMPATNETNTRSPSFIRTYVKPDTADVVTFYIDDITLDYSSAVDDRVLPTITNPTFSTSDTAVSLENGTVINGNKIAFSATVADNSALDLTSGKIYIDGVEVRPAVDNRGLSTAADAILEAGTHTVVFEIKDELGNPARLIRTFTVAGDAAVELGGHNDSGKIPTAQSIYYVDINVADLANVNKLVAQLKLNNSNTWETKGAIVAGGFKATFEYNEISELLTVTVEKDGAIGTALDNTLVSIPVRVWTYNLYDFVNEKYDDPAGYANKTSGYISSNNRPVVNIDVEVVYGAVDGNSFGGSINVATELTTISSPYHVHDETLTVLNKAPTLTAEGYENRTYCETCKSVVDWGTAIEKLTHNYQLVGDKFVCSDEGCGHVYQSGTGIFEMNGNLYYSINGVLKKGWNDADGKYCYAGSDYKLYIGDRTVNGVTYTFDESGVTEGAWVVTADGTKYSYGPSTYKRTYATIDGKEYYFGGDGYMYTGIRFIKHNPDTDPVWHDFGEDGAFDRNNPPADGLYWVNGDLYYCKDGVSQFGFQCVDGDYYYFRTGSGFARVGFATRNESYHVKNPAGIKFADGTVVPTGWYEFDAEGKMIIKHGADKDGCFYINGVKQLAYQLVKDDNGDYYFIAEYNKYVVNTTKYMSAERLAGTGLKPGYFDFGADGKMILKHGADADGYFYVNGIKQSAYQLIKDDNGDYYFIAEYNKYVVNTTKYMSAERLAGTGLKAGYFDFGADGKMILKNGADADGYFYVNGVKQSAYQLIKDDNGDYYFIAEYNKYVVNTTKYMSAERLAGTGLKPGYFDFGADGKMILKNGADADGYYYIKGVKQSAYQLIKDDNGDYYFIAEYNKYVANATKYMSSARLEGTGLPAGYYEFDASGKMIIE